MAYRCKWINWPLVIITHASPLGLTTKVLGLNARATTGAHTWLDFGEAGFTGNPGPSLHAKHICCVRVTQPCNFALPLGLGRPIGSSYTVV